MKVPYDKFTVEWDSKFQDLLFVAVSGAHSYGWARDDSDLDVRFVWMPDLTQALSVIHRGRTRQFTQKGVDYAFYPVHEFLRLLVKGNGNCLENLFQKKLYQNEELVQQVQQVTIDNLHVAFLKHYLGYSTSLLKDMENETRLKRYGIEKLLLCSYRVLQAGLILAREKKVVYTLQEQVWHDFHNNSVELLGFYLVNEKPSKQLLSDAKDDIAKLRSELEKEIETCTWLKMFPSVVYDQLLVDYYKGVGGEG